MAVRTLNLSDLLPGTLLYRKDLYTGFVDHYGVVAQTFPPWVAHIDKSQSGHLRVNLVSYEEFAANLPVTAEPVAAPVDLYQLWNRIEWVRQNKIPYGMLEWNRNWNCETFARYVRDGLPHSKQASNANQLLGWSMAILGGLAVVAALSDEEEEVDPRVGVRRDPKTGRFKK